MPRDSNTAPRATTLAAMRVVPFEPVHLSRLILQPHQRAWQGRVSEGEAGALAAHGQAWTALAGDGAEEGAGGAVMGCAGVLGPGHGRGLAWALLAGGLAEGGFGPSGFVALHRAVAAGMDGLGYRRIEAHVSPTFQQGRRWAEMLGFSLEGVMRSYLDDDAAMSANGESLSQHGEDGYGRRDVLLYARVRP